MCSNSNYAILYSFAVPPKYSSPINTINNSLFIFLYFITVRLLIYFYDSFSLSISLSFSLSLSHPFLLPEEERPKPKYVSNSFVKVLFYPRRCCTQTHFASLQTYGSSTCPTKDPRGREGGFWCKLSDYSYILTFRIDSDLCVFLYCPDMCCIRIRWACRGLKCLNTSRRSFIHYFFFPKQERKHMMNMWWSIFSRLRSPSV